MNGAGIIRYIFLKWNQTCILHHYKKQSLTVKGEAIKLSEDNIGRYLSNPGIEHIFNPKKAQIIMKKNSRTSVHRCHK